MVADIKTDKELKYCNPLGVFNKTIIPFALVRYKIVIATPRYAPRWLSIISYPTRAFGQNMMKSY